MRIALDFDGTYTEDPAMWDKFIKSARESGHEVWCVTMRYDNEEENADPIKYLQGKVNGILYTGRKAKLEYVRSTSTKIDVWIDDNPAWIYQDG